MRKVLAWLLAFALTGTLALFGVTFILRRAVDPALGENGAPVSDSLLRDEEKLVEKRVTELAELYGFAPKPVIDHINANVLRDLNEQASLWWSSVLREGAPGVELYWNNSELQQILAADPAMTRSDWEETENIVVTCADEIRKSMIRMVLPVRQPVIRLGLQEAGKRVDVTNLLSFLLGIPWAALALCALLAGLIALLLSGRVRSCRVCIGSALGGAALVMVAAVVLYLCAGIPPMIQEASDGLDLLYRHIISGAGIRAAALTAAMAAGCVLCLKNGRRRRDAR